MDFGIQGKNALIMASSKGLGKAVALELSKEGVNVFLCSRSENDLILAAKEIGAVTYKDAGFAVGDISTKKCISLLKKTGIKLRNLIGSK